MKKNLLHQVLKFENSKISYTFHKTLVLSIICAKCCSKDEKIFKGEEFIQVIKIHALINNMNE